MLLHNNLFIFLFLSASFLTSAEVDDPSSTEINEIIPRDAIKKLDPQLKQILLQAITKLEKKAIETTTVADEATTTYSTTFKSNEAVPSVQFYTATSDTENQSNTVALSSFLGGKNLPQRSISSLTTNEISGSGEEEIQFHITKPEKKVVVKKKPTITTRSTTTTTTSTTPKPTHNDDGENIEFVAKKDINFFEAPLVRAFTVEQNGFDNRFVPLSIQSQRPIAEAVTSTKLFHPNEATIERFKVIPGRTTTSPSPIPVSGPTRISIPTTSYVSTASPTPQSNNDLQLNNFLLERQRLLEQQIYELQRQAREQQEQILRQLKLLEVQTQKNYNLNFHNPKSTDFQRQRETEFDSRNNLNFIGQKTPTFNNSPSTTPKPNIGSINFTVRPRDDFNFPLQIQTSHHSQATAKPNADEINLTIRPSIEQYSFSVQQRQQPSQIESGHIQSFPTFFNNLVPTITNHQQPQPNSIQAQPSFHQHQQQQQQQLLEADNFQHLPQRSHQEFNTVPLNAFQIPLSNSQHLPETQHQQRNRGRHFRQESNIGNFGVNSNPSFQSQNFFQQFLPTQERPRDFHQSNQQFSNSFFQSALNHGI